MNVYIDPGVEYCAAAVFDRGGLIHVAWHRTADGAFQWLSKVHATVEIPVVRTGTRHKQAQDLIRLAAAAGRVAAHMPVTYVTPEQWKGQVPCTCTAKTTPEQCTHHRRMAAELSSAERAIVDRCGVVKSKLHNIYDAVTMGLRYEGRL